MAELMDRAVSGLCTPLKVGPPRRLLQLPASEASALQNRIQQTVRSQESSITSFKIANLLQFYLHTMQRTIGRGALLSRTLEELTELAYGVFYGAIETQGRGLLRVPLVSELNVVC